MKINEASFNNLLNMITYQTTNNKAITQKDNKKKTNFKQISDNTTEIINLLGKLDKAEKTKLIHIWQKLNLPFTEKNLKQLISLINNNSNNNINLAKIKIYAFFLKNGLPLLPDLVDGLANNLTKEGSLSEKITLKSSLPPQISKNLVINLNQSTKKLAEILKCYPNKIEDSLTLLRKEGSISQKILNQLLGQKLINNLDNNLLLHLELPLFFPEYNEIFSSHLQIWNETDKKSKDDGKNKIKDKYMICFIISLPKRKIIRADISCSLKRIKSSFKSNSPETCKIIKGKIQLLQNKLEKLNFVVDEPIIEPLEQDEGQTEMLSKLIPLSEDNNKTSNDIVHFDLHI